MLKLTFAVALTISSAASAQDYSKLVPLNDLGPREYAFTLHGGLYENGSNVMAADHFALGMAMAQNIQPRDADGNPSPNGKIVFLAVGFGETKRIMQSFTSIAENDVRVQHDSLVMLNAAFDGGNALFWAQPPDATPRYDIVQTETLLPAGVTPQQVQVAWVQIINDHPSISLPPPSADAWRLKSYIAETLLEMKQNYPNLQIAYLSSRVYGGYSVSHFNPEPFAYETGFPNRWIITAQMEEERMEHPEWYWDTRIGVIDPRTGIAPWVAWGPYLWANGTTPRSDGLTWQRGDFEADGETLSPSGAVKGGKLLFDFLLHEPTAKGWFLSGLDAPSRGRAARH